MASPLEAQQGEAFEAMAVRLSEHLEDESTSQDQ